MKDKVIFINGEWKIILNQKLLSHTWNAKGAAQAGLEVEQRRLLKKQQEVNKILTNNKKFTK